MNKISILHVLFLTFLLISCTKSEELSEVCQDGCETYVDLGVLQDKNGYFHIDLEPTDEKPSRFSIDAYATTTKPEYWYNETPIVEAEFYGDKKIIVNTGLFKEEVPLVQETTLYFSGNSNLLHTKRIVGPISPGMVGDTLNITMEVYWDAGNLFDLQTKVLKIIIE